MSNLVKMLQTIQQKGATTQWFIAHFHVMRKSGFQWNAIVMLSLPGDLRVLWYVLTSVPRWGEEKEGIEFGI